MSFVNSHTGTGHRCPTTTTGERKKKRERKRERERSKEKNIIGKLFLIHTMVYMNMYFYIWYGKSKSKKIFGDLFPNYILFFANWEANNGYGQRIPKTCRHPR